jgi:hypothetical protein
VTPGLLRFARNDEFFIDFDPFFGRRGAEEGFFGAFFSKKNFLALRVQCCGAVGVWWFWWG